VPVPKPAEDLLAQIEALRAENRRLRDLLGLDERAGDSHRNAWAPTLFSQTVFAAPIDEDTPFEAKVALMQSFFGARSDVFAVRWENAATGKSGWSPAVRGGWTNRAKTRDYLPLTDEVFTRHLLGQATIGIYPLLRDDTCMLLACDFDGGSWVLDALAFLDACHDVEVPAVLERSRSGNGAHVWIFFSAPVPAATARSLGASLLRRAMTARAELDLSSYDRFFPSQDFMPKGSFGNLIAVPLNGERLTVGATAFLDPTSLEPWPDQWRFLSSVARIAPEAVATLAESLQPVTSGPAMSLTDLLADDGPHLPDVVRAELGSRLSIERSGLPPPLVAALKHLASIQNPQFYEKQRMRFSTWDTPRFVRCYEEDLEWLHLPRGLVERTGDLLTEIGCRLDVMDVRPSPAPISIRFRSELRRQQRGAVAAVEPHERGVIVAPPGAGKTVMACAVIAHHQTPTLVLVDRRPLVEQWRARLCDHLGLDESQIGMIGGGKAQQTGFIDVAMIQTLARQDDPADTFSNYGLVVVDECHHIPAVSFEACVRRAPSRRWLGLTATPYRRDGLEGIIALQCGPIRHEIRPAEAEGIALVHRELIVHETETTVPQDEAREIHTVLAAVAEDEARTVQVCRDVRDAVAAGRTCLVLTQRTAHIDALVAGLAEMGTAALVLKGGLGKRARRAVSDAIESRSPGEGIVLVATGSYLGEGFDWPELDTLFLAFPIAFKGRVVQYVGRLLRAHEDKQGVQLHDYVDTQIPVLSRMHTKRIPAYRTLGFEAAKTRRK